MPQYVPITRTDAGADAIYGDSVRDWRKSRNAAVIGVTVFLILQLAIPISRIGDDARRFGWQMFSTAQRAPQFVVITESGEIDIENGDYLAKSRADLDLETLLPPHLCSVVPDAISIRWDEGEFEC